MVDTKERMNVGIILEQWLKANGYDGLYCVEGDVCGCRADDMAIRCDGIYLDCQPGYEGPDPSNEGGWSIYDDKKQAEEAKAMRNKFPGTCYHCGKLVEVGDGHFARIDSSLGVGTWRTIHASCCITARKERAAKEKDNG